MPFSVKQPTIEEQEILVPDVKLLRGKLSASLRGLINLSQERKSEARKGNDSSIKECMQCLNGQACGRDDCTIALSN